MTKTVADRIKEILLESGLRQYQFADAIKVSSSAVGSWRSGMIKEIKREHLLKVSETFGIEFRWLDTGEGPKYLPGQERKKPVLPIQHEGTWSHRLGLALEARGMDYKDLAVQMKLSKTIVNDWMRHKVHAPRRENIQKICKCLSVNEFWLMDGTGGMDDVEPVKYTDVQIDTPTTQRPLPFPRATQPYPCEQISSDEEWHTAFCLLLKTPKDRLSKAITLLQFVNTD